MIIFKGFLPRNSAQNLLLRGSLTQENSAQKVLVLRSSCRVPFYKRVRYAGPSDVCGDVRGPTIGGPHGAHRPPRQGPCQRLVKPLTGGVKNLILGVVEKSQLVIILCGVAAALRRSREGDGGRFFRLYFDRGGCETLPQGKGGILWTEDRWRLYCANLA